jgi:hypothetical protein
LATNRIAPKSHKWLYRKGTTRAIGTTADKEAISLRPAFRPILSERAGRMSPDRKLPTPVAAIRKPAVVDVLCATLVMYSGAKEWVTNSQHMKPVVPIQLSHTFRFLTTSVKFQSVPERVPAFPGRAGSRAYNKTRIPAKNAGALAAKKPHLQLKRDATCVARRGAAANPTSAAALTTMPILRPRVATGEESLTMAFTIGQAGPSASPRTMRNNNSWLKFCANPHAAQRVAEARRHGIKIILRPTRSERDPKKSPEKAQLIASDEPNIPT